MKAFCLWVIHTIQTLIQLLQECYQVTSTVQVVVESTAISEKLNTVMKMKIADLEEIDYLITELPADAVILTAYKKQ